MMRRLAFFALGAILAVISHHVFGATNLKLSDTATLWGPTGTAFDVCWNLPSADLPITRVYVRRTRAEGNQTEAIGTYPTAQLTDGTQGQKCLKGQKIPRLGHYSYEIRACMTEDTKELCSPWASSLDPTKSTVQGQPRAWWVYGFVPALGQPIPL